MTQILDVNSYNAAIAATRDERMAWWRDARFGMFVHYGLYSQLGRQEWSMSAENIPIEEYEKLADRFCPKEGAPREWAKLAKEAGMKYMVLTTRHHEGFSLWDSKANPYNSMNYGPHRDIVKEFVEACREYDLKIGFYTSLMDWHHPDGWKCAFDNEARKRFTKYIEDLNTELLTQYGKIDILWYDVPRPMQSWEGWDSLERNQRLRAIQPHIIINDRSLLPEDFGTPEEEIKAEGRDWEACMTFNGISWGYVDEEQAKEFSYTAPQILRMLKTCTIGGGNLLLNIGPKPDGSVPADVIEPLKRVGRWLQTNGEAVYGRRPKTERRDSTWISGTTVSLDEKTHYVWQWIWPAGGSFSLGGYRTAPKKITIMATGQDVPFTFDGHRITMTNMPEKCPDPNGTAVIKIEFDEKPEFIRFSRFPQLNFGKHYE